MSAPSRYAPLALLALLAGGGAMWWFNQAGGRREGVANADATTYALSVNVAFAELTLPPDNRPEHRKPREQTPLGPWSPVEGKNRAWRAALPVPIRHLFTKRPPAGMRLVDAAGQVIPHAAYTNNQDATWIFDEDSITIQGFDGDPSGQVFLNYPTAVLRESKLNRAFSGAADDASFARTSIQNGVESLAGLLLGAPATASWDVTVPKAGVLTFFPGIAPSELLDGTPSDGASLTVTLTVDGQAEELWSGSLKPGAFEKVKVDVSRWADKKARLTFSSDPGSSPDFDYVFVGEPVLSSQKRSPQRIVLAFIDTLRPDHLGVYGYERPTSPKLDAWAQGAAVFTNARSIAPWTLPSTRSVLTGREPELWGEVPTIQRVLREQGWVTAMFAGNPYLGSHFDMHLDWGVHRVALWPSAEEQVDAALSWLDVNEGRDALLLLHFMDAHLPYKEPEAYGDMFSGEAPEKLQKRKFHRPDVVSAQLTTPEDRGYLIGRYDNNIRYVDDQLARFLKATDEDDIVVVFADHGEEFWEHNGYEHGHTLFDELLRVPLIIRGPGVKAGKVAEPVALIDIAPTIAAIAGAPIPGATGVNLLAATQGDAPALTALKDRDLTFGRPLYGSERWGVLHGDMKYTVHEGREAIYDLGQDPVEKSNIVAESPEDDLGGEYRQRMGDALGREVAVGYRLVATASKEAPAEDLIVTLNVPGGISHVWVGVDSTEAGLATATFDGEVATATFHRGYRGSREVFVIPKAPMSGVTRQLTGTATLGTEAATLTISGTERLDKDLPKLRVPLTRAKIGGRFVVLTYGVAPVPGENTRGTSGFNEDIAEALEAIGYTVGPGSGSGEGSGSGTPNAGDNAPEGQPEGE
jgi:arylsulfatase A-like enzyme